MLPIGNSMDLTNNSSSSSNNNSPKSRTSVVVVQPDSLHRNAVADKNDPRSVFTKVHPWPIPEDGVLQQQQQQQVQLPQQQIQVSSETFRFNNNDDNINVVNNYPQQQQQIPNEQYSQQQLRQELHVANYMPSSLVPQGAEVAQLPSPIEDFDVISGKQVILRPRLSNNENVGNVADPESKEVKMMLPPPPLGIPAAESTFSSSISSNNVVGVGIDSPPQSQPIVYYYYDPQTLLQSPSALSSSSSSSSSNGEANLLPDTTPELTLPEIVYTSSGIPLTLEQVHAGGKNEVFLEIKKPPLNNKQEEAAVWKSSNSNGVVETEARMGSTTHPWNAVQNQLLHLHGGGGGSNSDANGASSWHSQDQLIVFFTVATMAIMVGALSARRLRNQRILESCMHPDLNDDDDDDNLEDFHVIGSVTRSSSRKHNGGGGIRYDKKYDLDTGVGGSRSVVSGFSAITGSGGVGKLKSSDFGALLSGSGGGGSGGYYGTNGGGGQLHWRGGDMEKFDV